MAKPGSERSLPPFDPPKPDVAAGLWLQLWYVHVYDRMPLKRTYVRLMTRSPSHKMLE